MSALRAEDSELEEGEGKAEPSVPCRGLRKELLECLRGSDCVRVVSVHSWKCSCKLLLYYTCAGIRHLASIPGLLPPHDKICVAQFTELERRRRRYDFIT